MKDCFLAAFILFATFARPLAAASPNLLTNGSFDSSLGGLVARPQRDLVVD